MAVIWKQYIKLKLTCWGFIKQRGACPAPPHGLDQMCCAKLHNWYLNSVIYRKERVRQSIKLKQEGDNETHIYNFLADNNESVDKVNQALKCWGWQKCRSTSTDPQDCSWHALQRKSQQRCIVSHIQVTWPRSSGAWPREWDVNSDAPLQNCKGKGKQ